MWHYDFKKNPITNEYVLDSEGYLIGTDEPHTVYCLGPIEQSDIDLFLNTIDVEKREGVRRYIENGKDCKAIGRKWFEATTSADTKFPNSLFFAFACYSFRFEDIYSFLTEHDVAEYCGFIDEVINLEARSIMSHMVGSLCKGMSFLDASNDTFSSWYYFDCFAKSIYRAKPKEGFSSSDVFLVDPRAYELKEIPKDNQLTLFSNKLYRCTDKG